MDDLIKRLEAATGPSREIEANPISDWYQYPYAFSVRARTYEEAATKFREAARRIHGKSDNAAALKARL